MSADEPAKTAADPSMEDILASIRRILTEEEVAAEPDAAAQHDAVDLAADTDDVFALDEEMLVTPPPASPSPAVTVDAPPPMPPAPSAPAPMVIDHEAFEPPPPPSPPPPARAPVSAEPLIAPEAEAAAASALTDLVRSVQAERHAAVYRGGPTIEDVVRAEIRPALKSWLDTHLPDLVERLVRAEIERVVGRVPM